MAATEDDAALKARLLELATADHELGYRGLHQALQSEEAFKSVGLKRVQKLVKELKEDASAPMQRPGTGYASSTPSAAVPVQQAVPAKKQILVTRSELSQKFGLMIDITPAPRGGHRITGVREGGVVDQWNKQNPGNSACVDDVLLLVNGKETYEAMMEEFKTALQCSLQTERPVFKQRQDEDPELLQRRSRAVEAMLPRMRQTVEEEFGQAALQDMSRVEEMYRRFAKSEVYEHESPLGLQFSPCFVEGLMPSPSLPFHDAQEYTWISELRKNHKVIQKEFRKDLARAEKELDAFAESLWTTGGYQTRRDWKIMPLVMAGKWIEEEEDRFKETTAVLRQVKQMTLLEAFFARIPARAELAPHSDNLNYVLTVQMAVDLGGGSSSSCSIRAGTQEKNLWEGQALAMDTSFVNSANNASASPCYFLVLRFWHPGLTEVERRALEVLHAALGT